MSLRDAIDPTKVYQVNGQVCELKTAPFSFAVGNNNQIIAAISGQKIRVMGVKLQTNGAAAGYIDLKDGSGGAILMRGMYPPPNTNGATSDLPVIDSGYFSTSTGVGLYCDVITTAQHGNIFYITYTP